MRRTIDRAHGLPRSILAILAVAFMAQPAMGGSPACRASEYHQLDFWLGNWSVYDNDGKGPRVARDEISSTLGACVVLEKYRPNDGRDGDGLFIYDASRRIWHQTWVTGSGHLLIVEGRFADGVLTMSGSNLGDDGRRVWYQATWSRQPRGVRQIALTSKDGGRSWQPAWDLLFVKSP
jgi:hypothetical protein